MSSSGFISSEDHQDHQGQQGGSGGVGGGSERGGSSTSAHKSFRQKAIDKALASSTLGFPSSEDQQRRGRARGSSSSHIINGTSVVVSASNYTSTPKNEREASISFRQNAIDKALEPSAISWHEHIENYDENLSRHSSRRSMLVRTDTSSFLRNSEKSPAFHDISGSSTLRRRRNSQHSSAFPEEVGETTLDEVEEGRSKPAGGETRTQILSTWELFYNRHIQLLVSLALFSYLGEYFRYVLEIIFGYACHHPGEYQLVGVIINNLNICTSDSGVNEGTGGAFFVDLPINVIGCFLMGLLVSGDGESIAINIPIAALPRSNFLQNWVVTHVGVRTGLCGSLTTFASWNTQMVVMLCGGDLGTGLGYSQWMSALWGYLIGLFASLQSFQFGVTIAYVLSRSYNPQLAMEADRITDKKAIGVLINRDLPDFERRFLHSIVLNEDEKEKEEEEDEKERRSSCKKENLRKYGNTHKDHYNDHIHHLRAWKKSTNDHRCGKKKVTTSGTNNDTTSLLSAAASTTDPDAAAVENNYTGADNNNNENYVHELQEIEKNLLVDNREPRQELLDIARDAGWNVNALRNWTSALDHEEKKRIIIESGGDIVDADSIDLGTVLEDAYFDGKGSGSKTTTACASASPLWEAAFNLVLFLLCTGVLIYGFMRMKDKLDVVSTKRAQQFLGALLSPFGTFSRWYLSRLNGSIKSKHWEWLPIGTFLANMIASVISALCVAITLKVPKKHHLAKMFLSAIKVGYAGSFSTVSTFAAETTGLFQALPRYLWGYYYCFGTLFAALVVGVCSYVWAVV